LSSFWIGYGKRISAVTNETASFTFVSDGCHTFYGGNIAKLVLMLSEFDKYGYMSTAEFTVL